MNFFEKEGHIAVVENKKTLEVNGFIYNNIHVDKIKDQINIIEAKPYIDTYTIHKSTLISEFNRSNTSRRLVLNFNNDVMLSSDPNCIMLIQLIYRNHEMNIIAYARSSDVNKFNDDLATVKYILKNFCDTLNLIPGNVTFFSGSFHEYI